MADDDGAALRADIERLDFKTEAIWMLLRMLFQLTAPQTKISSDRIREIITAWKNQSPPEGEQKAVPEAFHDELSVQLMPHLERFFADLSKRLAQTESKPDPK